MKGCITARRFVTFVYFLALKTFLVWMCLVSSTNIYSIEASLADTFGDYPWSSLNLPRSIIPVKYSMQLSLDPNKSTFNGSVNITFVVKEETNMIVLNMIALLNIKIKLRDSEGNLMKIKSETMYTLHENYIIKTKDFLDKEKKYVLETTYRRSITQDTLGIYKLTYMGSDKKAMPYIATQFFPNNGRRVFPCFDEPNMKAIFSVSIIHPKALTALSSAEVEQTNDLGHDMVSDTFKDTPIMSVHRLAILLITGIKPMLFEAANGHKLRLWVPEDLSNDTSEATQTIAYLQNFFTEYFGCPDDMGKTDHVVIPQLPFHVAENWGLNLYSKETFFPSNEWVMSIRPVSLGSTTAAQWFGCLMTFDWWNDLWIEKGTIQALSFFSQQNSTESNQVMLQSKFSEISELSTKEFSPLVVPIIKPRDIIGVATSVPANKAFSVMRMVMGFVGEGNFMHGIQEFTKNYRYSNFKASQLWEAMDGVTHLPHKIEDIMKAWTETEGLPIVNVKYEGDEYVLEQQNYKPKNSKYYELRNDKWVIPFMFITDETLWPETVWIDANSPAKLHRKQTLWFLGNVESWGRYLVNYEFDMWTKLLEHINFNNTKLSKISIINFKHDAAVLARVGLVPQVVIHSLGIMENEYD